MEIVKEPVQERSKETLHRILEAAETLMAERPFEKLTVQNIVKQAKTNTGSFYARFPDKTALLTALFQSHIEDVKAKVETALIDLPNLPPRKRVAGIVAVVGDAFQLRPALMRSGTLHVWNMPRGSNALVEPFTRKVEFFDELTEILQVIAESSGKRNAATAAPFALKILLSSSRQHYLFSDERTVLATSDRTFRENLSEMIYAYLTTGE